MKYKQAHDGDKIAPKMRGYKMRCCDCQLVHVINFKISDCGQLTFRVWRDNRATAASRRKKVRKMPKKKGSKKSGMFGKGGQTSGKTSGGTEKR